MDKSLIINLSQAEKMMASKVMSAAITRLFVNTVLMPPATLIWPTQSEITINLARDTTVNNATDANGWNLRMGLNFVNLSKLWILLGYSIRRHK